MSTNVTEFIEDLDVGDFKEKLGAALSEVAIGVMRNNKKGKVTIDIEMDVLNVEQLNVKSKLKYVRPISRGMQTEEETTVTPMYIGRNGELSIMQKKSLFDENNVIINAVN